MTKSRGIRNRRGVRQEWLTTAEPKNCACGCGGVVTPKPSHYQSGVPDFLRGHHARVTPPKGRPPGPPKPQNACECGCGQLAGPGKRFVAHHRAPWSPEARAKASTLKLGPLNPQYGKPAHNRLPPKPQKPCACGCGDLATPGRQFITGHNTAGKRLSNYTGWYLATGGYIRRHVPEHPFADKNGYVLDHRLIAERNLLTNDPTSCYLLPFGNRSYLDPDAVVHHIDGDKTNNHSSNLAVMTAGEHTALHHAQGDLSPFGR